MSVFDRDTLELIQTTADDARGAAGKLAIVPLPDDPLKRYAVVKPDGSYEILSPTAIPRKHALLSLDQVALAVEHYKEQNFEPAVWYSPRGIVIVLDNSRESRRLDVVRCDFEKTAAFAFFSEKAADSWLEQRTFVRLLRVVLADCLMETSSALLKVVKVLSFSESTTGHGKVELGRESLGRDLEAEIRSDAGELPETVSFNVRLFRDPTLTIRRRILCAVDMVPREHKFNLTPIAGEIERVTDEEMEEVADRLKDVADAPVILGVP